MDTPGTTPPQGTAAARYAHLEVDRQPYLDRAIRCAQLTVPSLFRTKGSNGTTDEITAWQSLGSYLVNNLTSKLTLTVFPPGLPFIRIMPSKQTLQDLAKITDEVRRANARVAIEGGLGETEKEFIAGVAEDGDDAQFMTVHKHLIVGGNHGVQMYQDSSIRSIPLERFVVVRDGQGNLLEFVIKDCLSFETLPEDIKAFLRGVGQDPGVQTSPRTKAEARRAAEVDLYTHGTLKDGKWEVYQEAKGYTVPGTEWTWAPKALPYFFPPLDLLPGEHYGRSYVEHFEGDLMTLDGLEQTISEGSAAVAQFIRLVRPGSVTNKTQLAQAKNGDVITGDVNDVGVVQGNKGADFNTAEKRLLAIGERLAKAFLLNSAVQRAGERVTAEEIRWVAQELNDALGGVYSGLVKSEQAPYAHLKMDALMRTGRMTDLPKKSVKVMVITGAAALSRNAEVEALDALANVPQGMIPLLPQNINDTIWFQKRANALQVGAGVVFTQDQKDAKVQAERQAQMQAQLAPEALKQGGQLLGKQMDNQAQQQQQAGPQQQGQPPQQEQVPA